jgi:hypothetical protein
LIIKAIIYDINLSPAHQQKLSRFAARQAVPQTSAAVGRCYPFYSP